MDNREIFESGVEFQNRQGDGMLINCNGTPTVFYHGTSFDFNEFDGYELPGWFSTNLDLVNSRYLGGQSDDAGPNIRPVFLRVENPLDLVSKFDMDDWISPSEIYRMVDLDNYVDLTEDFNRVSAPAWETVNNSKFSSAAKLGGFDGIKVLENGSLTLGVFDPKQIFYAIGTADYRNLCEEKLFLAEINRRSEEAISFIDKNKATKIKILQFCQ